MRKILCDALVERVGRPDFAFLTGDLGFMALEPLQQRAGDRFLNAGVAEQNMVGVAAGLASCGFRPWVYSIAPFAFARPFEQIRNDVCLHRLPVFIAGNGGGYAYGVMGATHHALEDYGVMLALPHMKAYVPAFGADVPEVIQRMYERSLPAYLRLGRDESPRDLQLPGYAAWRRLLTGGGACAVVVGPLAGSIISVLRDVEEQRRPSVWVVTELPIEPSAFPDPFMADLWRANHLVVIEEHVAQAGAGQMLASALAQRGSVPARFEQRCALGYPSGRYGSQAFHRRECGIDAETIARDIVVSS